MKRLPHPREIPTLSVPEAGMFLDLGRAASYVAAERYLATDGAEGLPVIRTGPRRMRVPTARLWVLLGLDPDCLPGSTRREESG